MSQNPDQIKSTQHVERLSTVLTDKKDSEKKKAKTKLKRKEKRKWEENKIDR